MLEEVVSALADVPPGWVVDATLGGGGHSEAILERCPQIRLLGLDRDPAALQAATARLARFAGRFVPAHAPFARIAEVCAAHQTGALSGLVADLGVSSHHLDRPERGFSFREPGPLDMRMDPTSGPTLDERLADISLEELADILYHYGDVRASIRGAKAVLEAWRDGARTTDVLAAHIARVMPGGGRLHPATQVFQALRIWVNDEGGQLQALLDAIPALMAPGATVAIIAFHSGEDRMVKDAFRDLAAGRYAGWQRQTRKPQVPSEDEVRDNPRARSARLRVIRRVTDAQVEEGRMGRGARRPDAGEG